MRRMLILLGVACTLRGAALPTTGAANSNTAGSASSVVAAARAHVAGNLLYVVAGFHDGCSTHTITISNTAVDTWTAIGAGLTDNTGVLCSRAYYAKNIIGNASDVVTATFDTSVLKPFITVTQISGADTTSPLDTSTLKTSNGTSVTSNAFTTTNANDLIIQGFVCYYTASPTTGLIGGVLSTIYGAASDMAGGGNTAVGYLSVSSIQTNITAAASIGAGGQYVNLHVAAFKSAAGPTTVRKRVTVMQ